MKQTGIVCIIIALLMFSAYMISCPVADPPPLDLGTNGPTGSTGNTGTTGPTGPTGEPATPDPWPGPWTGTASGSAQGFGWTDYYQGMYPDTPPQPVTTTVTMEEGYIKSIGIVGPSETADYIERMRDEVVPLIIAHNTFVVRHLTDATTGITYTFNAISEGGLIAVHAIRDAWEAANAISASIDKEMYILPAGSEETIEASYTPTSAAISWVSSAPAHASVDNNGRVTAHTPGTAVITLTVTITDDEGVEESLSARCFVVVF